MNRAPRGFSLLEVLLAVAVLGILAGILIPVYQTFNVKNSLDVAANDTVAALRKAQIYSQAVQQDSAWGVYVQAGSMTLYKGGSYTSRDTSFDDIVTFSSTITPSGVAEVNYAKMTGLPGATGTITLTSSTGLVRTITLNAKGLITY